MSFTDTFSPHAGPEQAPGLATLDDMIDSMGDPGELTGQQQAYLRALFESEDGLGMYLFAQIVCGCKELYPPLHLEFCEFLSKWGQLQLADGTTVHRSIQPGDEVVSSWRRLMLCVPRDAFKTTLGTRVNAFWQVSKDPTVTVGIFNENEEKAKQWVGAIQSVVENSKLYQTLWAERLPPGIHYREADKLGRRGVPRGWAWGSTGLLFNRPQSVVSELSIKAFGIGGSHAGYHFTHIIKDDIIGEKAAQSEAIMQDAIHWVDHARDIERPAHNGCELVNFTRWGHADVYAHLLRKWPEDYQVYHRSQLETPNGEPNISKGESIFPARMSTEQARREWERDPFTFSCVPSHSKILMEDFSHQPISKVVPGDVIVGFTLGYETHIVKKRSRSNTCLTRSVVQHVFQKEAEVYEYDLEDGTKVQCTPDHQWFTGKAREGKRRPYNALQQLAYHDLRALSRYIVPIDEQKELNTPEKIWAAGYLSGMFDGDGSQGKNKQGYRRAGVVGTVVVACQHSGFSPGVRAAIRRALAALEFEWSETIIEERQMVYFLLQGGRQARYRFLRLCKPSKGTTLESLYTSRFFKLKPTAWRSLGFQTVHALQTSTGNYIVEGFLSSNSQRMCLPMAGRDTSFQPTWIKRGEARLLGMEGVEPMFDIRPADYNPDWRHPDQPVDDPRTEPPRRQLMLSWIAKGILLDPAPSRKSERGQEPRARNGIVVCGMDGWGRWFVFESLPLREDPVTVLENILELSKKWRTQLVGIEEVNFSAIYAPLWSEILRGRMENKLQFCPLLTEGIDKDTRIRSMSGPHREGMVFYNDACTLEIQQELIEYPYGDTRDLIDALAYLPKLLSRPQTIYETNLGFLRAKRQQSQRSPMTGY